MIAIIVGSAVVWGLATVVTGSWEGGLFIAVVVLCMAVGGMRRRQEQLDQEARQQAVRDLIAATQEPIRRRWF